MERRYRLTDNEQFQRVKKEGRSWSHVLLVLCALPNELDYSRFGFSVSKRVGKAAVRNRAKRLLRESARARQAAIAPGQDLVFIARVLSRMPATARWIRPSRRHCCRPVCYVPEHNAGAAATDAWGLDI